MLVGQPSGATIAELGKMLRNLVRISDFRVVWKAIVSLVKRLRPLVDTLKPRLMAAILL